MSFQAHNPPGQRRLFFHANDGIKQIHTDPECRKHVWVSQFAEGFDQISIEIARLFPIRNKDWNIELNGVAAFEERQILLWER